MGKRSGRSTKAGRRAQVRRRLLVERLGDRRVLAAITGAVFEDANVSFQRDADEQGLASRLVYIDANENAALDNGERFVVAETDGTFAFTDLDEGSYLLRLFNGTSAQQQTFPIDADVAGEALAVTGTQVLLDGDSSLVLTSDSVVVGDLQGGGSTEVGVGLSVTKMQPLPDGSLLVIGTGSEGETAWIVDPEGATSSAIDLAGDGQPLPWSDVAVDADGRGILISSASQQATIHAVDATDPASGIVVTATETIVPIDTQILASTTGGRSVLASGDTNGLQLRLWSNATATPIAESVPVSGVSELLAFDDAAGLLVTRSLDGGVTVHDVNESFAPLHSLSDVTGPVAIDGVRDLLMTVSPVDAMLRLIDLRDGSLIADLALDLSSIGQAAALVLGDSPDSIVVLGAAGIAEIALNRTTAHRVAVEAGQDVAPIEFGLVLTGSNSAPAYQSLPDFETEEDSVLIESAPAALAGSDGLLGAIDAQGDEFVLLQAGPAANGTAILEFDGAISYQPSDDFFGIDRVPVLLHDGFSASSRIDLEVVVTAMPDPPEDVDIDVAPIPENIEPNSPIGTVSVVDVDLERNHRIIIEDGRFEVRDGIIYILGPVNFETEPVVQVLVNVTDEDYNSVLTKAVSLRVADENDPITGIIPRVGSVVENVPGDIATTELVVLDEDVDQTHTLSVDDGRFIIENGRLRLDDDVSVNFDDEQEILVNVSASDGAGSSYTEEIMIHVLDVNHQPLAISLSNQTVMELEPGAEVGEVWVDDVTPDERFELTVDDPRFEIDGNLLQLIEDQYVERANQEEIELTITARDTEGEYDKLEETFVILVIENQTPYHNDDNPYDVNHSGDVTTLDALLVINYLNTYGPGPVGRGDPGYGYDVNGDGYVTALDALLILNELARLRNAGEAVNDLPAGEQVDPGETIADSTGSPNGFSADGDDDAGQSDREGIFNRWQGGSTRQLRFTASDPDDTAGKSLTPQSPNSGASNDFAASVDQTLRLLGDDA